MKECLIINDYSAFGSNSLAVGLPVLAALGVKAHALPTAVLSAQTEFDGYAKTELDLAPFFSAVEKLTDGVPAVLSGYFAKKEQICALADYLANARPDLYLLDPVLGDGGALYHGFSQENVKALQPLLPYATLLTPNLTEACLLAGEPYDAVAANCKRNGAVAALPVARKLLLLGAKNVAITGVCYEKEIQTLFGNADGATVIAQPLKTQSRSGSGDLFAALAFAFLLRGKNCETACRLAANFTASALEKTRSTDGRFGTDFEKILPDLCAFAQKELHPAD